MTLDQLYGTVVNCLHSVAPKYDIANKYIIKVNEVNWFKCIMLTQVTTQSLLTLAPRDMSNGTTRCLDCLPYLSLYLRKSFYQWIILAACLIKYVQLSGVIVGYHLLGMGVCIYCDNFGYSIITQYLENIGKGG